MSSDSLNGSAGVLKKTAVLIPAFDAAAHLASVVEGVAPFVPPVRVVVVDDGSTDDTYRVAGTTGARVIRHNVNRGKGAALATGFDEVRAMGMAYVITLDADGQHDPTEIPAFARRVAESGADIVVGNRLGDARDMPWIRLMTNRLTSWAVSRLARAKIDDSQNGYRMIATRVLTDIRLVTTRYDTESELLIKAGRGGARIESVPVRTIYAEERSAINPLVDSLRFFRLVGRALFW